MDENEGLDGDDWREYKELKRVERSDRRSSAPDQLAAAGIGFESKNMGAHLVVANGEFKVDFWPGTTLWKCRKWKTSRYGLGRLIEHIRKCNKQETCK